MTVFNEYLSHVTPTQKQTFEHIQKLAHELIPDAEEVISYGMPAFKYKGKAVITWGAFKNHMSLFPATDPSLKEIPGLEKFHTSKGTLQFTEENPIPEDMLRKLIKLRLAAVSA